MPTWPATLKFFSARGGYTLTSPEGNTIETAMSVGPPKKRRRSSAGPRLFKGRIDNLPVAQLAVFEAFFHDDLLDGALSFQAVDPLTLVTRTYRFVDTFEVRPGKPLRVRIDADLRILA